MLLVWQLPVETDAPRWCQTWTHVNEINHWRITLYDFLVWNIHVHCVWRLEFLPKHRLLQSSMCSAGFPKRSTCWILFGSDPPSVSWYLPIAVQGYVPVCPLSRNTMYSWCGRNLHRSQWNTHCIGSFLWYSEFCWWTRLWLILCIVIKHPRYPRCRCLVCCCIFLHIWKTN